MEINLLFLHPLLSLHNMLLIFYLKLYTFSVRVYTRIRKQENVEPVYALFINNRQLEGGIYALNIFYTQKPIAFLFAGAKRKPQ